MDDDDSVGGASFPSAPVPACPSDADVCPPTLSGPLGSSSSSTSNVSFNEDRHGAHRYATASAPVSSRHSTSGHGRSSHYVASSSAPSTSAGSSSHRHSRVHSTTSSSAAQTYSHPHHYTQPPPSSGPYPIQQQHPSAGGPYAAPYPVVEHAHANGRMPFPPPPSAHTPQFFPHVAALPPVPTSSYYQQSQQQHRPSLSMAPPSLPGSLLPLPLSSFRPSPSSFPLSHHALQPVPAQSEPQQQAGQTPTPACSPPASAGLHALTAGARDGDGDMPHAGAGAQAQAGATPAAAPSDPWPLTGATTTTTARATSSERGGPAASPPLTSSSTTASPPPAVHLPPVSDLLKLPAILNPSPPSGPAASLLSLSPSAPPSTTPIAPPPPTATSSAAGPPAAAAAPRPTEEAVAGLSHHELLANPLYRSLVDCVWRVSHGQSV